MALPRSERAARWFRTCLTLALCCGAATIAGRAHGQGFGGQISYIGGLGPIAQQRPLCLCVYNDAQLLDGRGCLIFHQNPVTYGINSLNPGDYYLVAFVDLHPNEQLDADEPFQIYRNRDAPPADAVSATSGATDIDFTFGDENLPNAPTPTPTLPALPSLTPTVSPSASPTSSAAPSTTATASVTPTVVAGDCNGDGQVTIDELVHGVGIALDTLSADTCPPADVNRNGAVTVDELVLAVNAALAG